MQEAINLFSLVVVAAIPYAVVFALGQRIVELFVSMAFRGEIKL